MTEESDDIIVLSDDEEEVKIESIISSAQSEPMNKSRPVQKSTYTKSSTKNRSPMLILTEPKSLTYGIERGYKLKQIHGMKPLANENKLLYLVEYDSCDDYEFVPSDILRQHCDENILIEYLEKLTQFTN